MNTLWNFKSQRSNACSGRILFVLLLFTAPPSLLPAVFKNSLAGQLADASTGKAVYYANVFLANTTLGSTSDSSGSYLIKAIPPGHYTLVVAHIGYETEQINLQIGAGDKSIYNFVLHPRVMELQSLYIEGLRDPEWLRQLERFKKEFLGFSENAGACEMVNPEVMRLTLEGTNLRAASAAPLEIIHHRLGYRILVIIKSFFIRDDQTYYSLLPVFQPLTPKDATQEKEWQVNREQAFWGSYRHFFYALFSGQLEAAQFSVESVDESRPFKASMNRYTSRSAPGSIYSNTSYGLIKKIHFNNYLRIRYQENFAKTSFLKLPFDTLQVDLTGSSMTDAKIIRSGYWGSIRFADELPLDYQPE
ncbi:MAG: carboxypeptidase-like regulatory domain-containing protein [Calditrichaeota bacterium]|nr:MAG: carboxypeptidase-like regulatory domain-containing protein [Calditrichota bacterium]